MNTTTMASKICDIGLDLQKIFKKLSKLESQHDNLLQLLNNEISQRQNLEKHTITTHEAFSGQLSALKETYDHFEEAISTSIEKNRLAILEEVQKKNTNLINLFESNLNSEKAQHYTIANNSTNATNTNIKHLENQVMSIDTQIEDKFTKIEEMITNEFKQYHSELNSNVVKIEFIEKKMNESFTTMKNDIVNIVKEINYMKKDMEQFKTFRKTTVQNFQSFQKDFIKNDEIISQFSSKIDLLISDLESKMKNYNDLFTNHTNDLEGIKNDIFNQFKEINGTIANKMKNFIDNTTNQIDCNNKEIDHFEKHIISEHEKFINFIQNHLDEQNGNIRKLFDYVNDDIDMLKSKGDTMENLMKKLRADVFNSINETEEFLQKKYESIFRIVNKVQ